MMPSKWGFLRETPKQVEDASKKHPENVYTTLDAYLAVIFPNTNDWVKNKGCGIKIQGGKSSIRPDYRSESLKLVIEFDGLPHYTNPQNIIEDKLKEIAYCEHGYKVVRIPYFIQLTREVVHQMFGVEVQVELFDPNLPSFVIPNKGEAGNTPAFLCPLGVKRMAAEFKRYPQQYQVNLDALKRMPTDLSGIDFLKQEYNQLQA